MQRREELHTRICELYRSKKKQYKSATILYNDIAVEVGTCWQTVHRVLKLKKLI